MNHFDHDKLDAYRAAIELVAIADQIIEQMPTGRAYLNEQLAKAALSVVNNTAEGAGEFRRYNETSPNPARSFHSLRVAAGHGGALIRRASTAWLLAPRPSVPPCSTSAASSGWPTRPFGYRGATFSFASWPC